MNWAKGGTKTGRGSSLKESAHYVLHDKDGLGEGRVGSIELLNLATEDPKRAWREMQTTVDAVSAIKARAGIKQTGQKNERPVYAISLSWHPDDRPDSKHMLETARGVIKLLGLSQHQAMIVEHTDRPHKHIHIVANLIHPDNGKTARPNLDERKLDRWAHEYEVGRATIRSFQRAAKFERGHEMDQKKDSSRKAFAKALERKEAIKQDLDEKKTGLSAKHKEAGAARTSEKETAWTEYKDRKAAIYDKYQPVLDDIWRRKVKAPALELRPPGMAQQREWKGLAGAMLSLGMAERKYPMRNIFTRALERVIPKVPKAQEYKPSLKDTFREVRPGKDVMEPMKSSPSVRRYVEKHREGRMPNPKQRSEAVKLARNNELAALAAEFEVKSLDMRTRHEKDRAAARAEWVKFKAEANRAWADYRKENGLAPKKNEWEIRRQENLKTFNEASKDKDIERRRTEDERQQPAQDERKQRVEQEVAATEPEHSKEEAAPPLVVEPIHERSGPEDALLQAYWAAVERDHAEDIERGR